MEKETIDAKDIKYVIKTNLNMVEEYGGDGGSVYFGVIEESSEASIFCVLKGAELVGLQNGLKGQIPLAELERQIDKGISEKVDTKYYFLEIN